MKNLKRFTLLGLCLCFTGLSVGCTSGNNTADNRITTESKGVEDVLSEGIAADNASADASAASSSGDGLADASATSSSVDTSTDASAAASSGAAGAEVYNPTPSDEGSGFVTENSGNVDVDLTILPSTMVYSEIYNMMCAPKDYVGKVIRITGNFSVFHDENTGLDYFACINQDATACCSQGIEFVLRGNNKYPEDFPEVGSYIEVQGVFGSYMEDENEYYSLMDATLCVPSATTDSTPPDFEDEENVD